MPWGVDDAPAGYVEKLVAAIVGLRIPIEQATGKRKLSQDRKPSDYEGVLAGLAGSGDALDKAVARAMAELL